MKYECEMIRDLLPLYHDKVCSNVSERVVEEHLEECAPCREIAKKLKNTAYDEKLQIERESVIGAHARKVKRKTFMVGAYMAGILMIPVGVCLICNIAIGHSLDWFFIVLASLMVFASLTVVPLVVEGKRGLCTLGAFTISLLFLLLVCNIYSRGRWFPVAASGVLLGLSVVFMPFVVYQIKLPKPLHCQKGLLVMTVDTILLYGVIIISHFYGRADKIYLLKGLMINTICLLLPWVVFGIIRYLKTNGLIKAGICTIIIGVFCAFINDVIALVLEGRLHICILNADLSRWAMGMPMTGQGNTVDANVWLLTLIFSLTIGICLIAAGVKKSRKPMENQ